MSWPIWRRFGPVLTLAVSILSSGAPVAHAAPDPGVPAYDLPFLLDTVPGSAMADQNGHGRAAADLADKLVLVGLMTVRCPSLCVQRALAMAAVARDLPDDVRARLRYVAISVDPADTPADLSRFAEAMHLDATLWTLLATDAGQAAKIRDAIGLQVRRKGDDPGEPASNLFLFDRRGRLMQSFSGRALDGSRLARDLVDLARFDASEMDAPQPSKP